VFEGEKHVALYFALLPLLFYLKAKKLENYLMNCGVSYLCSIFPFFKRIQVILIQSSALDP